VRISAFLLSLLLCLSAPVRLQAQDPGAQQDAEAAREKLLRAEDQLDNIQANSEATKLAVADMKATIVKLQTDVAQAQADNATLKQQLADLQAAFDKSEAAHAKEQKVLLDTVAGMIASGKGAPKTSGKKKEASSAASSQAKTPEEDATGTNATTAPAPSTATADASTNAAPDTDTPPVKTQKGYYHIVASGETLTLICNAFRQEGVKVTVSEIQKANDLTDKSILKVGQKLFIPKPGT